jgi:polar amino acid transport system substrate-binding protein
MIRIFLLFILFLSSSCSHAPRERIKVGIDPTWYPQNFGEQNPYVNGFIDDLLLRLAKEMNIELNKVPIYSKYDIALSTLPPYTYNQAKYDFSQNILRIGPVLILPTQVKTRKLEHFAHSVIGVVAGNDVSALLQKYPDILVRNYPTTKDLLDAVVMQDIQGAILNRIEAVGFISGIYNGKLKIASIPLNDAGIHFIAEKGKHKELVHSLDDKITQLKKKEYYKDLLEKWKL